MFAQFDAWKPATRLGVRKRDICLVNYFPRGAAHMIWFTLYLELCRS